MIQDETPRKAIPDVVLLSTNEVAERYGIGRHRLRDLVKAGEIPVIKFGSRNLRYLPQTIEAWLIAQQRVEVSK